jgi:hypothetical protein
MSRTVRIRRQDGTMRVVTYSRSGQVKTDQPACERCQGTGVSADDRVAYARRILSRWASNSDANGNAAHASLYRDALALIDGTDDDYLRQLRDRAGHDWDPLAVGAMTCKSCGMVYSDTCPAECDGVMPY